MEDHVSVVTVAPPSPAFRYVVVVTKVHNQFVFMTHSKIRQVSRILKGKDKLPDLARLRNSTHTRLVVGRTIVSQEN